MNINKAVFPVAGLGIRFLPVTKASPKEMLPLVDKPLIQYSVEEAVLSGIKEIVFVTGKGKTAIEDYFDVSLELEAILEKKGEKELVELIKRISNMVNISYTRQKEPLGLGHAILCAKNLIGNEPFSVFLGDDIMDSKIPAMQQMLSVFKKYQCTIIGVKKVNREEIQRYGIIKAQKLEKGIYRVLDMIEKPIPDKAPSNLSIVGRYILTPNIFRIIENTLPGENGEIQITDALRTLLSREPVFALELDGIRYDAGDKAGFLKANIVFGLKREDIRKELKKFIKNLKL